MHELEQRLRELDIDCVLDVATGRGGFIQSLFQELDLEKPGMAVDVVRKGFELVRDQTAEWPIRYAQMDAQHLALASSSFDLVCISNSLHHLPAPVRALQEMLRVTMNRGHLLVGEMIADGQTAEQMTHVLLHHWWGKIDSLQGIVHNETYTRAQLLGLVQQTDWRELECFDQLDLQADALDAELREHIDGAIDMYIKRAEGLQDFDVLRVEGERLRQRLHQVGFHSATRANILVRRV